MEGKEKQHTISFKCDKAYYEKIKVHSHLEMVSISDFMRRAVDNKIKQG